MKTKTIHEVQRGLYQNRSTVVIVIIFRGLKFQIKYYKSCPEGLVQLVKEDNPLFVDHQIHVGAFAFKALEEEPVEV